MDIKKTYNYARREDQLKSHVISACSSFAAISAVIGIVYGTVVQPAIKDTAQKCVLDTIEPHCKVQAESEKNVNQKLDLIISKLSDMGERVSKIEGKLSR